MTPFLQLALALAIIIGAAKAGGYLSLRLGQPSVLGELITGIILGPSILNILHTPYFSDEHLVEVIHMMAEIGVLLLMFIAGLELHLSDLMKSSKVSALAGTFGVIVPLIMGVALALLFAESLDSAIFVGLILAATSVSISAQTLMELQVLRSRVGIGLLGSAVFDDILVILGLSILTALTLSGSQTGGIQTAALIALRMALFLGLAGALGFLLLPSLSRLIAGLPISQGLIAFAFIMVLLYGWSAEEFGGMAAITGSFLAGLAFSRSPVKQRIESGVLSLAYGVFVPIFFINVGLTANAREVTGNTFWLFVTMSIIAVVGKITGAGLGGLMSGFSRRESLQLGIGMMSRGEVGLIAATLGIEQGIIPANIFSAVVGVVIVTTILTPPLLRASFQGMEEPKRESGEKILSGEQKKARAGSASARHNPPPSEGG